MTSPSDEQQQHIVDGSGWFSEDITRVPLAMRELLEEYAGVPEDRVLQHVLEIRKLAFTLFPYPCIGQFRFLDLKLSEHDLYPAILSRLKSGRENFLDAGCCFGQELRKLAYDGVPARALHGIDLEPGFWDLGYELFRDKQRMKEATFFSCNLLDQTALPELEDQIDILLANSLLHLFTWDDQVTAACRLVTFLRPKQGSLILGRQVGALEAGEYRGLSEESTSYRHNIESFQRLWDVVGARTGSKWKVEATLDLKDIVNGVNLGQKWMETGTRRLHFVVTRL